MLVRSGQLIEQGGLAAILVSGERELQRLPLGSAGPAQARSASALAEGRMIEHGAARVFAGRVMGVVYPHQADARRVRAAQGELIPTQTDLERVAHGGMLHHGHFRARGETHVEDMLAQGRVIGIDGGDDRIFADLERIETHGPRARRSALRPPPGFILQKCPLLLHQVPLPAPTHPLGQGAWRISYRGYSSRRGYRLHPGPMSPATQNSANRGGRTGNAGMGPRWAAPLHPDAPRDRQPPQA